MTILNTSPDLNEAVSPPLQMVQATVDLREFQRWAGTRRLISGNTFDQGYAMHCLLMGVYGDAAPKPFRLITSRCPGDFRGVLYGYGWADSDTLREAAGLYADPLQSRAIPAENLNSKQMPAQWQQGKRLGFELLLRPVVRYSQRSEWKGAERDVFQVEAERYPKGGMNRDREEVYRDWLATQFQKGGATLEKAVLKSFERVRSVRKLHHRPVEGPSALVAGILNIDDPAAFAGLLGRGVGRHRSYGYGMLLLRPPAKAAGPRPSNTGTQAP